MQASVQSDPRLPEQPRVKRFKTKDARIVVNIPRVFGVVLRDEARRRNVEPGDILKDPIESFLRQFVTQWSDGVAAGGASGSSPRASSSPAQQSKAA